jgi:hypothetical protein
MKREACKSEHDMRMKVPITQQPVEAETQPPDIQRRINAGWLRLWRKAYPNTPPPVEGGRRKTEGGGAGDSSYRVCGPIQGDMKTEKPEDRRRKTEDGRPNSEVRSRRSQVRGQRAEDRGQKSEDRGRRAEDRGAAAVGYLSRFLCVGFALALLATGCVGPRPLKGGKAVTAHKPGGIVEQTLVQGENPSQATKQDQETVKVRTYTVPVGSRVEQLSAAGAPSGSPQPSTINSQPSPTFLLSSPMPVVEREETRAHTELGAAQKDTARELGAKLASLKGIVWVGVGLFVFGLASLVWPPLKVIVGSVTTSGALMLGGVALMVLPSMVVGNELLILGVVGIAVGGWFLAHRHGQLRGQVAASADGQTQGSNQSSVTSNQSSVASGQ